MDCKACESLLNEVKSHICNDLSALKRHYGFSKKLDSFFNIIKNDIFPEFVKCLDDFQIELYDFQIKNFLAEKKGPVELSKQLTLDVFSDVFDNLSWSVRAGIKKPFSKEKFMSSAFDLKMNTLLSVFRVGYDTSFCVSDSGSRFIYEQLNQIYEKLSKIKKGVVFNTFKMQFNFKQSWDASNFKEGYQVELFNSIFKHKFKFNSDVSPDKLLKIIFPNNYFAPGHPRELSGLVNWQEIKSKLIQILDDNYTAFVMFCIVNNADDCVIFRAILSDLSFIKESVKSYNISLSNIRNKYYQEIKDNIKSKDRIIKKYKKGGYSEPQFRVNKVKQVHDSFIFNEKLERKFALNDFKEKILSNTWTLNNKTYFFTSGQVDRLVALNLSFCKLISEDGMSLEDQKEVLLKNIFEFLASAIFKSDKQFDNLLEPLKRLDYWFLNRLREYVCDNAEKFESLNNAVLSLQKTSVALRSEKNIVLSSNVIFDTYKSELDNNLESLGAIADDIEEKFFNNTYEKKPRKKWVSGFSCVPEKNSDFKNKPQSKLSVILVILDTKDKISGVRGILNDRFEWVRDNFRSTDYVESGVLVLEA